MEDEFDDVVELDNLRFSDKARAEILRLYRLHNLVGRSGRGFELTLYQREPLKPCKMHGGIACAGPEWHCVMPLNDDIAALNGLREKLKTLPTVRPTGS